ncbi:MAG: flippase [Candidatus Moranbacteria bacterium]|nr:flippase [Candidatus Moranbacteria bacterium]
MAIARKIAYNVFISSTAKVLSTILALVSIGFITRYLGKEGFGNYATVLAFFSFFTAFSDLGLYHISTREISRIGAAEEKIMGNIFSLRIISSLLMLIIAPFLLLVFSYPPEVERGIIIAAAAFLFSSGYQVLNGVFQKNLAMDKVAISELIGKVIQVAVVVAAVKLNLGFDWIMSSLLFYMVVTFSIVFIWSRKYTRFKMHFDFAYWKEFLKESIPMGIATIITFLYFKMDTILLSVMRGSADVGIYNAAYKVLENITFFPAMVAGLVMPIMSASIFANRKNFEEISNKTFKFFVILIVPIVVGTLFLAEGIINLIGGAGFAESANILRIIMFSLAFIFFGNFFNTILIVGNLQKKLMFVLALAAIINISLNLIFIPRFSYTAAAYVSVITEMAVVALTAYLVIKKIKYIPKLEKIPGVLMGGLFMAAFLYVFREFNFFFLALGSAAVYFLLLWAFRVIQTSEIISLISKKGVEEYETLP